MLNNHDISMKLENFAGNIFKKNFSHWGTIFSADYLDKTNHLYDAMALLLFLNGNSDSIDFLNKLSKTIESCEILTTDKYKELYEEFLTFFDDEYKDSFVIIQK